jgi:hypothetical protein
VEDKQRRNDGCPKCSKESDWCGSCQDRNINIGSIALLGTIFWFFPVAYRLIFPRGIVTRYAREKKAAVKQKQLEQSLVEQEKALRDWCQREGVPWSIFEVAIKGDRQRG